MNKQKKKKKKFFAICSAIRQQPGDQGGKALTPANPIARGVGAEQKKGRGLIAKAVFITNI